MLWKVPPKAKVYEALSTVADGRVDLLDGNKAKVTSSSRDKSYVVKWNADASAMISNDNGTYWQKYIGYPMIAVLMLLGKIAYSPDIAKLFANVHWKKINVKYGNDFDKAVEEVLWELETQGHDRSVIEQEVDAIYEQLRKIQLEKLEQEKTPIG